MADYWTCPLCKYGIIPVQGGPSPNFLCPPCRAKVQQRTRDDALRDYALRKGTG